MTVAATNRAVARIASVLAVAMLLAAAVRAGDPRFESLVLSDAKDGGAKNVFATNTPRIFLAGRLLDVPAGAKVRCVWIAAKTKAAPANYQIDATQHTAGRGANRASFALSRPNKGWPPGDYRVELFIDGKPAGTQRFSVRP